MKSTINLLLAVCLMLICNAADAQSKRQRLTREQLAEVQAKHIAEEVKMDKETGKRFIEAYCDFQKEIWALGPRPRHLRRSMTDKETEDVLKERFVHSQKILDIRQKYYEIYSEFLTQKQIRQVFDLERQMMNRLAKRNKNTRTNK